MWNVGRLIYQDQARIGSVGTCSWTDTNASSRLSEPSLIALHVWLIQVFLVVYSTGFEIISTSSSATSKWMSAFSLAGVGSAVERILIEFGFVKFFAVSVWLLLVNLSLSLILWRCQGAFLWLLWYMLNCTWSVSRKRRGFRPCSFAFSFSAWWAVSLSSFCNHFGRTLSNVADFGVAGVRGVLGDGRRIPAKIDSLCCRLTHVL